MSSFRIANKYPIPNGFPEILHDYIKEVLRNQPQDILDFSIKYFASIQEGSDKVDLKYQNKQNKQERPVSNFTVNENNKTFENTKSEMNYRDPKNMENFQQENPIITERDENQTVSNKSEYIKSNVMTFNNAISPSETPKGESFEACKNMVNEVFDLYHKNEFSLDNLEDKKEIDSMNSSKHNSEGNHTVYSKETLRKAGEFVDNIIDESKEKLKVEEAKNNAIYFKTHQQGGEKDIAEANSSVYSKETLQKASDFVDNVFRESNEQLQQLKNNK